MAGSWLHIFWVYCVIFCMCNQLSKAEPLFGENVRKAGKKESPFVALVKVRDAAKKDYRYCSGSLLSKKSVLTAAQCVPGENEGIHNINVCVGSTSKSKCKCYESRTWTTYNAWMKQRKRDLEFQVNDIAVITLKQEVSESLVFKPLTVPKQVKDEFCSWAVRLAGWGCLPASQEPSRMKTTAVKVMTKKKCDLAIENGDKGYEKSVVLCTFAEPEVILNDADIGSPLFCDNKIVGVTVGKEHVRFPDANEFTPVGIHVSTNYYKDFINEVAKLH